MRLSLSRIVEFISADALRTGDAVAEGYSIDSRTIRQGELFFAVSGERLNGHDYVEQALRNGAVAAVVNRPEKTRLPANAPLLFVDDTLAALQSLATQVRILWGKKLVGITGSAGKTTTKEAIAHVLSTKLHVLKSEGNFNNHFGLPLTLLKLQPEHDIAVIEMGMSHAGEIAALAKIAQPNIGVVTNVAPVHLEFFESIEGIAQAKRELIDSLPADGIAILNADDARVSKFAELFAGKIVTYGTGSAVNVRAENIESRGTAGTTFKISAAGLSADAHLPLVGAHNVLNALAAVSVALQFDFSLAEGVSALATLSPALKRGEVIQLGNITVVNDCYNSNPKALEAMVNALAGMPAKRRIVVAGEMLELGPTAAEAHRAAGAHIAAKKIDVLLGVRGLAEPLVDSARAAGMRAEFVTGAEEAGDWLARETRDGDLVLLKGSRGVKLEVALDRWKSLVEADLTRK